MTGGMDPRDAGVEIQTNTRFRLIKSPSSYVVPDLTTAVRVDGEDEFRNCVVIEVGNTQPLRELRQKAQMWLYNTARVHLVVLVDLQEIPQAYEDSEGWVIAKSTAKENAYNWPLDWEVEADGGVYQREQEWFEEELRKRMGVVGAIDALKDKVKEEMKAWMLRRDKEGKLIPALVEPIDAHVYLYRRAPGVSGVPVLQEPALKSSLEDGSDSTPNDDNDEDYNNAHHNHSNSDSNSSDNDEADKAADSNTDTVSDDNEVIHVTPGNVIESSLINATHNSHIDTDNSEDNDLNATLDLIFDIKFMTHSIPLATIPPPTISLTIAELFGPLPTASYVNESSSSITAATNFAIEIPPALLADIPVHLQPQAHKKITFDLNKVGRRLVEDMGRMRPQRALDRVENIVEGVYQVWWKRQSAERTKKEEQERQQRVEEERKGRIEAREEKKRERQAREAAVKGQKRKMPHRGQQRGHSTVNVGGHDDNGRSREDSDTEYDDRESSAGRVLRRGRVLAAGKVGTKRRAINL